MRQSSIFSALIALSRFLLSHARGTSGGTIAQDIAVIREHRLETIIGSASGVSDISTWLSSMSSDGKWPDTEVNYTTGCNAQRANWPAGAHWIRLATMAAAYHGAAPGGQQWVGNEGLRTKISTGMDWWFGRDYTASDCLYNGGNSGNCPCGTPGLWNTNWFSNVILVPLLVAQSCLILNDTLSNTQLSNCTRTTTRAYSPFYDQNRQGFVSGANILDMAKIGIDQGIRVSNVTLVTEAYGRIHDQLVVEPAIQVDGIKPDGSFGQHTGLLYNGNYGTVFSNNVLALEEAAAGTQFAASNTQKSVFSALFDGNKWMIFYNTATGVLHWDLSALPRFISFPVADKQPTATIMTNLTQVQHVGDQWGSNMLQQFASSLRGTFSTANAGRLVGNRMFFSNDYMVHRGGSYVSSLKMYSTRTKNTEFTNSQNPFGFHLADGALYTYVDGNEYEDIAASWDWNKIPGITTDYNATKLQGNNAGYTGVQKFVGGASTGSIGVAAMRYTNPYTKAFGFQKAWFFMDDDVQRILVNNVSSSTSAPIFSILDQKRRSGSVMLANSATGALYTASSNSTQPVYALWHANVGYTVNPSSPLFFQVGKKTGSWQAIGTSTQPPYTVDMFSAWIQHQNTNVSVAYTAFPGVDAATFAAKRAAASRYRTLRNDGEVSAVSDDARNTSMAVFWSTSGGSVQVSSALTITASANSVLIYRQAEGTITVADPSQTISSLNITLNRSGVNKTITFVLPGGPGGMAGSSVTKSF